MSTLSSQPHSESFESAPDDSHQPTEPERSHSVSFESAPAEFHQPTEPERYRRSLSGIYPDSRYLSITTIVGAILQLVLFFIAYAWLTEQFPALRNGYFALLVSFAIVVYFGHLVYSRIPLLQLTVSSEVLNEKVEISRSAVKRALERAHSLLDPRDESEVDMSFGVWEESEKKIISSKTDWEKARTSEPSLEEDDEIVHPSRLQERKKIG